MRREPCPQQGEHLQQLADQSAQAALYVALPAALPVGVHGGWRVNCLTCWLFEGQTVLAVVLADSYACQDWQVADQKRFLEGVEVAVAAAGTAYLACEVAGWLLQAWDLLAI